VSLLGTGGMGEVYRARDPQLSRNVALKILPDVFASEPERLARFGREAQVLASLNHPNIAQIYAIETSGSTRALVMELVEGETLAERIAKGPLPLDEALAIAKQIAEALEAAHEQGIIHRDLKPANIKVRDDGTVKVLDFGLAKLAEPAAAGVVQPVSPLTQSPTITSPAMMTGVGVLLGTAAYMSPEQAKGRPADKRSDIWAFGCVLFEMLTGTRAFASDEVTETLAFVITREPTWDHLSPSLPASLQRLLRRSLEKDSRKRLADVADARLELEEARRAESELPVPRERSFRRERVAWAAAVLALAVAGLLAFMSRRDTPQPSELRLDIVTPSTTDPMSLAVSPDGKAVVFSATSQGETRLWLRSLDLGSARPLAGTEFATLPFWSPDSRSIGFFASSRLKRIDLEGGSVLTLATAPLGNGGTWNREGTIVFVPSGPSPIVRVSAHGGEVSSVPIANEPGTLYRSPQFLPDGRHFLYCAVTAAGKSGVYLGDLDGSETRHLLDADAAASLSSSGYLVFVRQQALFAQRFDPVHLSLAGSPVPVVGQVATSRNHIAALSTSSVGPIVFRSGSAEGARQLTWVGRTGEQLGRIGELDSANPRAPSLSPDAKFVAVTRNVRGNEDVWIIDTERGGSRRFTFNDARDLWPIWSPDGRRLVWRRTGDQNSGLYQQEVSGSREELLLDDNAGDPTDLAPDGHVLLYRRLTPSLATEIWALPMIGPRKPFPLVQTPFRTVDAQFSPDGKWIAYESDETGVSEIFVQPFPGPGGKQQITTTGGRQVRWRLDGKELFYIGLDSRLMTVPIQLPTDGHRIETGAPAPLFLTGLPAEEGINRQQYAVSRDGNRFLIVRPAENSTAPITMILNWRPKE
jgi:serine/threonine protein kinase